MCCTMAGGAFPVVIAACLLVGWAILHCVYFRTTAHRVRADIARFLAGQTHVFRPRTDLARVLLALAPLIGAALIAISRLEDYRHDGYDVTTGSILGMLVAYFSYRRYYPGLKSRQCDTPYPSRAEWASSSGYGKLRDEEARADSSGTYSVDDMEHGTEHVPLQGTSRDRDQERLGASSRES